MAGVRHHMIFGLHRQPIIDGLGVIGVRKDFVTVAAPKLDRHRDGGKRLGRERIATAGAAITAAPMRGS